MNILQQLIDAQPSGATLWLGEEGLGPEIEGPIVIHRPITIEGAGAILWAGSGPVLQVDCGGRVVLRNMSIECTGASLSGPDALAIAVARGEVCLENVHVTGELHGIPETAVWRCPSAVWIRARAAETVTFRINAPADCLVSWDIEGVGQGSREMSAGQRWDASLTVSEEAVPRSLIRGTIRIVSRSSNWQATIPVRGWVRQSVDRGGDGGVGGEPNKRWLLIFLGGILVALAIAGVAWRLCLPPMLPLLPLEYDLKEMHYQSGHGEIKVDLDLSACWERGSARDLQIVGEGDYSIHDLRTGSKEIYHGSFASTGSLERTQNRVSFTIANIQRLQFERWSIEGALTLKPSDPNVVLAADRVKFRGQILPTE